MYLRVDWVGFMFYKEYNNFNRVVKVKVCRNISCVKLLGRLQSVQLQDGCGVAEVDAALQTHYAGVMLTHGIITPSLPHHYS